MANMGRLAAVWTMLWLVGLAAQWTAADPSMSIPPHILASLRNATTFGELEQRLKLMPSSKDSAMHQQASGRIRGGGVGGVAPAAARTRSGASDSGAATRSGGDVSVIDEPKQSRDSCKIVNICVPLPIPEYTGVLLFPKCIELPQCLGGCCDHGSDCHAVQADPVRVKYKRWRIVDDTGQGAFEFLEENLADMARHKGCGCAQCPNQPVCSERQEMVNCKCQCKNGDEKARCQGGGFRWSEEKCECTCAETSCRPSTFFNPHTCSCDHIRSFDDSTVDANTWEDEDYQPYYHSERQSATTPYRRHVRRPGP